MENRNLVLSKYTYLFVSQEQKHFVYCSRNNSFFAIEHDMFLQLLRCKDDKTEIKNLDEESISFLRERKILVESGEDELFLLECQYETDKRAYSKHAIGLTVAPTLGCNFSCHYCFEENKRSGMMDVDTQEALIAFLNNHKESRELHLNWYGGEPLLAIDVIADLLEKITSKTKLKITKHQLVTNGYFINEKVLSLFKKYPLDIVQITLDGNEERHNSIRKTKNNKPTYERILNNVEIILRELLTPNIHIRVNIERNNITDFYEICKNLKERWNDKRVIVYPGFLRMDNETKTGYNDRCMDRKDIADFMLDVIGKGLVDEQLYPRMCLSKTCAANRLCSYIVGPKGEVYKCWNDVGNPQKVVGNVHENSVTNRTLLCKYIVGSQWYQNEACKKCFFLPICGGACSWYVLRNKYENGHYETCTCIQKVPGILKKCLENSCSIR